MKRLLVTGAGGFLGWHVSRLAAQHHRVFGTFLNSESKLPSVTPIRIDLTDFHRLDAVFSEIRPQGVIHTAAASKPESCEKNPGETDVINTAVPAHLAGLCGRAGIDYLFTSSDLVFDGRRAPYAEGDATGPINRYGRQKEAAERAVLDRCRHALVCRIPLMFGWSGSENRAFDSQMIESIRSGEPLHLFKDEFRTPADAHSVAEGLLHLLGRESGCLHLGGRERISRLDLGRRIARVMGVNKPPLVGVLQNDIPMAAGRPADVSLNSEKAFASGYNPRPLDAAIRETLAAQLL